MGGIIAAGVGLFLLIMAFKGPETWLAVWQILVKQHA